MRIQNDNSIHIIYIYHSKTNIMSLNTILTYDSGAKAGIESLNQATEAKSRSHPMKIKECVTMSDFYQQVLNPWFKLQKPKWLLKPSLFSTRKEFLALFRGNFCNYKGGQSDYTHYFIFLFEWQVLVTD